MKTWLIRGLVVAILVFGGATFGYILKAAETAPEQAKTVQATPQPLTVDELLRLVNEERAKVGVKPLRLNDNMMMTAQWKAQDMDTRNYFSHWPETIDGKSNSEKYTVNLEMRKLLAADCVESSENIYQQTPTVTSESALKGWMDSKPHREALLDPKYESTGFGIAGYKVVEHFCDES